MNDFVGSLLIDKPAGITSHDVVARIRRAVGTRRVGHAGTLDPFATGLLVVCVGRATRLIRYLADLEKEYIATVRLGFATDTQDLTGKPSTPLVSAHNVTRDGVRRVLREFEGRQTQIPPMFSAKKVQGERLYKAARAGRDVEREPVEVVISSVELIEVDGCAIGSNPDGTADFKIRVRCSSGTYIRTLGNDIGARLGVGAHLAALRRTRIGRFEVGSALTLEGVDAKAGSGESKGLLLSPADLLSHLPAIRLNDAEVAGVMNGRAVELPDADGVVGGGASPLRLCDKRCELVAVGEYIPSHGVVMPRVVLRVAE